MPEATVNQNRDRELRRAMMAPGTDNRMVGMNANPGVAASAKKIGAADCGTRTGRRFAATTSAQNAAAPAARPS
jgi:hypothetical protein